MRNFKRSFLIFLKKQKEGNSFFMKSIANDDKMISIFGVSWVALLIVMISFKGIFLGFVFTVLLSATVSMIAYNLYEFITGRKL